MTSLSSIADIERSVQFTDDGFSFVNTAGDLIMNHEFEQGFVQFKESQGAGGRRAYIWQVLSAVGDDLGDVLYTNVRNYIQKVSDVDSCTIQQLKSMMEMLGFDYTIFDKFDMYPPEVLNLVNVLTVNRKYLMSNKLLKDVLISALYEDGQDRFGSYGSVISGGVSSVGEYLSSLDPEQETYRNLSAFAGRADFVVDARVLRGDDSISSDGFVEFARHLYQNLLLDFLTLKHGDSVYVLSSIDAQDSVEKETHFIDADTRKYLAEENIDNRDYKIQHGIDVFFDESGIADDINDGNDSLDNYSGWERKLLEKVITQREGSYYGVPNSRYAYYRTRKVKEYRDFILDKYYSTTLSSDSSLQYKIDPNYYNLQSAGQLKLFNVNSDKIPAGKTLSDLTPYELLIYGVIDKDIFDSVVESLMNTTLYIIQLREKIKLQTRKNYMRGTNNLLLYVINEYLLDYQRHTRLSAVRQYFDSNPPKIENLKVVEYYDQTEYYNLETDKDWLSLSGGATVNDRFWEGKLETEPQDISKYNSFTLNQIQEFYLSTLNMKGEYKALPLEYSALSSEKDYLDDFLDAVYGCGSVRSSVNEIGFINAQLERDGEWTYELYQHLVSLSSNYDSFNEYLSAGDYTYDEDSPVSSQISDVTENYIFVNLSDEYLSGVSSVYDQFIVSSENLSDGISALNRSYYDIISGDMEFYFVKPDPDTYPDCYDPQTGEYRHDWYWQNEAWDGNLEYVYDKYSMLYSYCETSGNIVNHPLIDTCESISSELDALSCEHYDDIAVALSSYGYIDVEAEYFGDELQSTYDFCNSKITERTTYLTDLLNSLKTEAQSLRSSYDQQKQQLPNIIAQYKSSAGLSSLWYCPFAVGKKVCGAKKTGDEYQCPYEPDTTVDALAKGVSSKKKKDGTWYTTYYNSNTGLYYYEPEDKDGDRVSGSYNYEGSLGDSEEIDIDDSDIETLAKNLLDFLNQMTSVEYAKEEYTGYDDDGDEKTFTRCKLSKISRGMNDIGVASAINQAVTEINNLENSVANLQKTIKDLFNLDDTTAISASTVYDTISAIIAFLNDHGYEIFSNDTTLKYFREKLSQINKLKSRFKTIEDRYQNDIIGNSKQGQYLEDCNIDRDLTFRNLEKILKYSTSKDASNRKSLLAQVQIGLDEYLSLQEQFQAVVEALAEYETLPSQYVAGGLMLEDELVKFEEFLVNDVYLKTERQQAIIDAIKDTIFGYLDVIESEISADLGETIGFDEAVRNRLNDVNFYEKDEYLAKKEMFLEYGGQKFCYYPYYNFKNIEHPSYQIHPFLWNFVEQDSYTEKLTKQFYNINIDDFEKDAIASAISSYVGEFGNVIDEWKHRTLDFSGYTTRYEDSSHIQNQVWSEAVDFDGSFHPNAISDLNSRYSECLSSMRLRQAGEIATKPQFIDRIETAFRKTPLSARTLVNVMSLVTSTISGATTVKQEFFDEISRYIPTGLSADQLTAALDRNMYETFYGRYYDHLGLTRHDIGVDADRIDEYWPAISAITRDNDLSGVYDIYRYRRDINGNSVILFKTYGKADPTYFEKKNTPGDLWTRNENRPLAFPAFWGKHSNICMDRQKYFFPTILRLVKPQQTSGNLSAQLAEGLSSCRYFYDFCESNDGQYIGLVTYPTDKGKYEETSAGTAVVSSFNGDESIPFDCENSMIVNCYSEVVTNEDGDKINIYYSSEDALTRQDYIWSGEGEDVRTRLSSYPLTADVSNYAYIGSYSRGTQNVYHLYAQKLYLSAGGALLSNAVRMCWINGTTLMTPWVTEYGIIQGQTGEDICFSYDSSKNMLTFAHLTEAQEREYPVQGGVFQNRNADAMNSNDEFTTNVRLVNVTNSGRAMRVSGSSSQTNINADMSYIPAYPDKDKPTDIVQQRLTNRFRSVELLGKSNDISEKAQSVNADVNQYLDDDDISANYQFGMVYEEFDNELDKTLRVYKNPTIKNESQSQDRLQWTQPLHDGYDRHDIDTLRVLAYNTDSLGKSIYYTGKLKDLLSGPVEMRYDTQLSAESRISGIQYDVTVNGLTMRRYGNFSSNRIAGVSSVQLEVLSAETGMSANMYFGIDDSELPYEYAHVGAGKIRLVVFNTNDLDQFDKYHLLDTYGVVYAISASEQIATEYKYGDGWTIIRNPKDENFHDELIRYYDDKYGRRKRFDEIHISDYSNLSDVWLMRTSQRLQFKYREEDVFDLSSKSYYFPAINCRYPKSAGNFIDDYVNVQYSGNDTMDGYFNDYDLFVFDLIDQARCMSSIGTVELPVWDYAYDARRVYEDYLSVDESGRKPVQNKDKYDVNDEDDMMEFYHCFEEETDVDTVVKGQETYVNQVASKKIRFDMPVDGADLTEFSRLYVNYRKTPEQTIELFFNYFNYINTPFVEIADDGRTYSKVVDGSYLRLDSGEDGLLDIYVQLKYFESGDLMGEKMVKLATYHVYNVSDDKPKFMLDKVYSVEPGDQLIYEESTVSFKVTDTDIDMSTLGSNTYGKGNIAVEVERTDNVPLPYTFYVEYPQNLVTPVYSAKDERTYSYQIDGTRLLVNVYGDATTVTVPVKTAKAKQYMEDYFDQEYPCFVDETDVNAVNVKITDGYVCLRS